MCLHKKHVHLLPSPPMKCEIRVNSIRGRFTSGTIIKSAASYAGVIKIQHVMVGPGNTAWRVKNKVHVIRTPRNLLYYHGSNREI